MAVQSSIVSVLITPTLVASSSAVTLQDTAPITVRNDSGGTIYLGGSGVTTATGLAVPTATASSLDLGPGDDLYAIAGSTLPLQVLKQRL